MSSYAFGGEGLAPGTFGLEFAKPIPVHAQTPGALAAVEAVKRAGKEKRDKLVEDAIVTDLGRPPFNPYDRDPVPKAAHDLLALAEAHGFEAHVIALNDRCTVEGIDRGGGVAFRAYWIRGRTNGGTWHEARERYEIVADHRPIKVDANKRTGLKGYRSAGVGETRLALVASRLGTAHNITELTEKVGSHGR